MLTGKELRYWETALDSPPLSADFDHLASSEVVLGLQERIRQVCQSSVKRASANPAHIVTADQRSRDESEVWSQVSVLVRQLQESRIVMKRLVMLQQAQKNKVNSARRDTPPRKIKVIDDSAEAPAPPPQENSKPVSFCGDDVEASLGAMVRHKHSGLVQAQGCRALIELIQRGKKNVILNAKRRAHAEQWECDSCLARNSVTGHEGSLNCSHCSMAASQAALAAAAAAVIAEKKRIAVAEANSRGAGSELKRVVDGGGILIIVDAMRRFSEDRQVLEAASLCLAQIMGESPLLVEQIAESGGIREILNAMRYFSRDASSSSSSLEIVTQNMGILASPALVQDQVARIEGDAFASVVVGCLKSQLGKASKRALRLQALGCLALANLALKEDCYTVLLINECDAHSLIVQIMLEDVWRGDANIAASGLWALGTLARKLADGSEVSARSKINQAGAVQIAMECASAFPASQAVQNNVKLLFSRLGVQHADGEAEPSEQGCILS